MSLRLPARLGCESARVIPIASAKTKVKRGISPPRKSRSFLSVALTDVKKLDLEFDLAQRLTGDQFDARPARGHQALIVENDVQIADLGEDLIRLKAFERLRLVTAIEAELF